MKRGQDKPDQLTLRVNWTGSSETGTGSLETGQEKYSQLMHAVVSCAIDTLILLSAYT